MKREDGIRRHRPAGIGVAEAEGLEIDLPAVLLDQHHRAGNFSGADFVTEEIVDASEFFRRENRRLRCGVIGARWRGAENDQPDRGKQRRMTTAGYELATHAKKPRQGESIARLNSNPDG